MGMDLDRTRGKSYENTVWDGDGEAQGARHHQGQLSAISVLDVICGDWHPETLGVLAFSEHNV